MVKQTRRESEPVDFVVEQITDERTKKEEKDGECDKQEKEGECLSKNLGEKGGEHTESRKKKKEGVDKTPKRSPKKIPCRYFERGNCSNPKCSFTHPEEDKNKERNNARRDAVGRSRGNYQEHQRGERNDAQMDAGGHDRERGHKETEECYYFNRYGNCRFGDRCYYYHYTKNNRPKENERQRDNKRRENRYKDDGEKHKQQNDKGIEDIKDMMEKMTSQQEAVKKQFNFLEDGMKKIKRYIK